MDECECCGTGDVPLKGYAPSVALARYERAEPVMLCQVCAGLPVSNPAQYPDKPNGDVIRVLCHLTNLLLKKI